MQQKFIFSAFSLALVFSAFTASAETHTVQVVSDYDNMRMVFDPQEVTIKKGDTVTWVNLADEDHNMVTYPDGYPKGAKGFTSPFLKKKDEKWSHTFAASGTYEYHCIPHIMMGMRGKVIVDKPSQKAEMNIPTAEERKTYRDQLLTFFDEDDFDIMPDYVSERLKKQ